MARRVILKRAQKLEGYTGSRADARDLYRRGKNLLEGIEKDEEESRGRETRYGRIGMTLGVLTVALAAGAGVTALPSTVERVFASVIAFFAAVMAGLLILINPEKEHGSAKVATALWSSLGDDVVGCLAEVNRLSEGADARDIEQKLGQLEARRAALKLTT